MIESFIEETNKANTKDDVYHLFKTAMEKLGYDRLVYCYATDQPKLNKKAEFGIISTYPEEWLAYYNQSNFMDHDSVVKQLFKTNGAFTLESITKPIELTKIQKKIMHEAEDIGIHSGIGVGIHQSINEISGFGITSSYKRNDLNKHLMSKVNLLAFQFHEAYSARNFKRPGPDQVILSERERERLHWMSEGKSDTVIADLLFIQHATVRYHVQNIFQKFAVNNKTMSVVKAVKLGLIKPTLVQVPYQG